MTYRDEIRGLLAEAPHRDELRRLASWCFDAAAERKGQTAAVLNWLAHAAVEEWAGGL